MYQVSFFRLEDLLVLRRTGCPLFRMQIGFLGNRIVEFIPIKHLKSSNSASGRSLEDWERAVLEKVLSYATGADAM
jgi:hypothetical protein